MGGCQCPPSKRGLFNLLGGLSLEFHPRVSRTAHEPCVRAWGIPGDGSLLPFTQESPNSSILKAPRLELTHKQNSQTK